MGDKKKEALIHFNRNNILIAAKKLFETKGIEKTTVDDIAKEADYSKSTVYVYFKSKDEILATILLEHFILLKDCFAESIAREKDIEVCYQAICKDMVTLYARYPLYFEKLLKEIRVTREDIEAKNIYYEIYKVGEEINDQIELLLKRGIANGYLREDLNLIPTVLYLWSSLSSAISFAKEKEAYLKLRLQMTQEEYLTYCMGLTLDAIRRR